MFSFQELGRSEQNVVIEILLSFWKFERIFFKVGIYYLSSLQVYVLLVVYQIFSVDWYFDGVDGYKREEIIIVLLVVIMMVICCILGFGVNFCILQSKG